MTTLEETQAQGRESTDRKPQDSNATAGRQTQQQAPSKANAAKDQSAQDETFTVSFDDWFKA